jgi:hypothetical protein
VLHEEFHEHLEGQRHSEKLDTDITAMEELAERFHGLAHGAGDVDVADIRGDAHELLRLSYRISRSIDRVERHAQGADARVGIRHMRDEHREIKRNCEQLDFLVGSGWDIVDSEADRMANYAKTLHDEFHEHLDRYEMAGQMERALEELEGHTEHMHELAHDSSGSHRDADHLLRDLRDVFSVSRRVDEILTRQTERGVLTSDWDGIVHMRDALTDVESSANLLRYLLDKEAGHNTHHPDRHHPPRPRPHLHEDHHHYD